MLLFSREVWKVWQRYGRLEAAQMLVLPYLPYLPYLFPHAHMMRVHIRARTSCVRISFQVWKVWKVWKKPCFCGSQPSIPLPYLGEVWNLFVFCKSETCYD